MAGSLGFGPFSSIFPQDVTSKDMELLKTRLEESQELTTMKYHYTNMAHFEKQKAIENWKIPFTESEFIYSYTGVIHAGIDLKEIKLDSKDKQVIVTIPKAKILAHQVNDDSLKIIDEDRSFINPFKLSDITDFQAELNAQMEADALGNGLLTEAQEYSKVQVKNLFFDMIRSINPDIELKIEVAK
ncbi:DUF4230 domain-containing protein [Facklamia sp. P12950]|uniref:DUF4230 domain-containing protein n=1 Tax=Facklamia sp. P12950 TaxID=3421951 RepID=UPI003D179D34